VRLFRDGETPATRDEGFGNAQTNDHLIRILRVLGHLAHAVQDRRGLQDYITTITNTTCITQVATVFVPVSDQDRALEFYLAKLGFEKRVDFSYGEIHRWIEVAPPGSTNAIALVPPSEGNSIGGDRTYCAFTTKDIESDHATLRARGVDVDAEIARKGTHRSGLVSLDVIVEDPVPPQFFFRDSDGNRFLIVDPS
jgi:catechol 2,3-dioxygenase-like lactoylglutathione lyase family enzyme